VAYLSSTATIAGKDIWLRFVAIGIEQVSGPYPFDVGEGLMPNRQYVVYVSSDEASSVVLLGAFECIDNRRLWGYKFRFDLFDIGDHHMPLIAHGMGSDSEMLRF
jgi:hypothetical protein